MGEICLLMSVGNLGMQLFDGYAVENGMHLNCLCSFVGFFMVGFGQSKLGLKRVVFKVLVADFFFGCFCE